MGNMRNVYGPHHPLMWVNIRKVESILERGPAYLVKYYQTYGICQLASYLGCSTREAVERLDAIRASLQERVRLVQEVKNSESASKRRLQKVQPRRNEPPPIKFRIVGNLSPQVRLIIKEVVDKSVATYKVGRVSVLEIPRDPQKFKFKTRIWIHVARITFQRCLNLFIFDEYVAFWKQNFSDVKSGLSFSKPHKDNQIRDFIDVLLSKLAESHRNSEPKYKKRVRIQDIQSKVAETYDVTVDDILLRNTTSRISRIRHIAVYLAHVLTSMSPHAIGRRFDGRDHTTIAYSINKVDALFRTDKSASPQFRLMICSIITVRLKKR